MALFIPASRPLIFEGRRNLIRLRFADSISDASKWLHRYGLGSWRRKVPIGWTTERRIRDLRTKGRRMREDLYKPGWNDCQTFVNIMAQFLHVQDLPPFRKRSEKFQRAIKYHQNKFLTPLTTKKFNGLVPLHLAHPTGGAYFSD
jgi:hypothetical protein